jgi:hypothetical protein
MWRLAHLPPRVHAGDLVVMKRPIFTRWLKAAFAAGVTACAVPGVAGATDYSVWLPECDDRAVRTSGSCVG